jgi:hypothetical protein
VVVVVVVGALVVVAGVVVVVVVGALVVVAGVVVVVVVGALVVVAGALVVEVVVVGPPDSSASATISFLARPMPCTVSGSRSDRPFGEPEQAPAMTAMPSARDNARRRFI